MKNQKKQFFFLSIFLTTLILWSCSDNTDGKVTNTEINENIKKYLVVLETSESDYSAAIKGDRDKAKDLATDVLTRSKAKNGIGMTVPQAKAFLNNPKSQNPYSDFIIATSNYFFLDGQPAGNKNRAINIGQANVWFREAYTPTKGFNSANHKHYFYKLLQATKTHKDANSKVPEASWILLHEMLVILGIADAKPLRIHSGLLGALNGVGDIDIYDYDDAYFGNMAKARSIVEMILVQKIGMNANASKKFVNAPKTKANRQAFAQAVGDYLFSPANQPSQWLGKSNPVHINIPAQRSKIVLDGFYNGHKPSSLKMVQAEIRHKDGEDKTTSLFLIISRLFCKIQWR